MFGFRSRNTLHMNFSELPKSPNVIGYSNFEGTGTTDEQNL